MSWLDELETALKKLPEATWSSTPDIEQLECEIWAHIPRLIAIVRKSEWSGDGLFRGKIVDACPLCFARETLNKGHSERCEYHPDWKKDER